MSNNPVDKEKNNGNWSFMDKNLDEPKDMGGTPESFIVEDEEESEALVKDEGGGFENSNDEEVEDRQLEEGQEAHQESRKGRSKDKSRRKREDARIRRENYQYYKSIDYSGFIERLFARGVDFAIVLGFGYLIYKKAGLVPAVMWIPFIDLFIRIVMTYFFGCTVGKFLFGVRVISRNSGKLTIGQVLIREFSKVISGLFLNLGYISIIVSRRKRAWHDMLACTAVTSGGRDECQYAREVYEERPEKWNWKVAVPITVVLIIGTALLINRGAFYAINNVGMIGFSRVFNTMPTEFRYRLPSPSLGYTSLNKEVAQLGDRDGDGGYELFIEGVSGNTSFVKNLRFIGSRPVEGDIGIESPVNIIQFRMVDIDGDKKDELAVLGDDKILRIYHLDKDSGENEAAEKGDTEGGEGSEKTGEAEAELTFGPLDYGTIRAVIKGKPSESLPERIYILGDNNRLSVISMDGEGALSSQEFSLPSEGNLMSITMGRFLDKNYLIGLTEGGELKLYHFDGKDYKVEMEMELPIKGMAALWAKDIDMDGENEILVCSPENNDRPYSLMAAYSITKKGLKLDWDGGRGYRVKADELSLTFEDGMDMDKDKKFEAYMSIRKAAGQEGSFSIFLFEGNKYYFMANDILRAFAITKPGQ